MDYSMLSCFVYLAVHPHRFSHSWPCLPESLDTKSLPHLVTSLHPYFPFSKSLPHNLFADPHPLTPVESYRFKNSGGGWSRRFTPTLHKSFSCNTYGSPRKCSKQKTYDLPKSFRCNTYKKPGGVHLSSQKPISLSSNPSSVPYLVTSLLHYFARRSWRGRISGQRAKMEVVSPPRGVNSPRTTHHSGRTASTTSRKILLTAFS